MAKVFYLNSNHLHHNVLCVPRSHGLVLLHRNVPTPIVSRPQLNEIGILAAGPIRGYGSGAG